jgi:hypothetical protein
VDREFAARPRRDDPRKGGADRLRREGEVLEADDAVAVHVRERAEVAAPRVEPLAEEFFARGRAEAARVARKVDRGPGVAHDDERDRLLETCEEINREFE